MAIATVMLYLAVLYVRPGEIIPGWEGYPFAAASLGLALFAVGVSWLMRPRSFLNQPHDVYFAGFFLAAVLSNPSWGWFGGARLAIDALFPIVLGYIAIRGAVRTPSHLRWLGYALVALTLFQAANGISQFKTGVGFGNVEAYVQKVLPTDGEASEPDIVLRVRGTGIFNDPNDLAMAFVAAMPFLIGPFLAKRTRFSGRALTAILSIPIVVALYYTNSRGGMLGFAAVLTPYGWRSGRWIARAAIVLGLVGMMALAPSRMSQMDAEESSAQGRVQAWSAGLQMLKSRPILGVGFGQYTEYHERVAHNSFVHTLGELGLVGGFFFAGMLYWLFRGLAPVSSKAGNVTGLALEPLELWGNDLFMGSVGLAVSMVFLSRQYVPLLYIWLALGASYRGILQEAGAPVKPANFREVAKVGGLTLAGIVGVYFAVRVLAVWSAV